MAADQYVAETGDPSGISCFCYKETYRIDCNGRFLEICGVQFRKDYTGIFSGFGPGNGSGGTFFCFFCCGSADGAIDHGIKATPVASFIILCLIWIPSRNLSVFISFLMVFPVVYTNILEGIRQTDKQLLEMADSFGAGVGKKLQFIYLSQVMPYAVTACKLGLGLCWKAGIAAEVIGIPAGSIGEKLYKAKVYLETPDLFAWTIVIIAVSVGFEKIFMFALRRSVGE